MYIILWHVPDIVESCALCKNCTTGRNLISANGEKRGCSKNYVRHEGITPDKQRMIVVLMGRGNGIYMYKYYYHNDFSGNPSYVPPVRKYPCGCRHGS